jgi:hypothetical protein
MTRGPTILPFRYERIIASSVAVWVIALASYLIVVDRKLDLTQVYFLKILLSLSVAVLVATLPGFIELKYNLLGMTVRGAGGAAAFVFVYLASPGVPALRSVASESINRRPFLKLVDLKVIDDKFDIERFYDTWVNRIYETGTFPVVFREFPIVDVKLVNYGDVSAFIK